MIYGRRQSIGAPRPAESSRATVELAARDSRQKAGRPRQKRLAVDRLRRPRRQTVRGRPRPRRAAPLASPPPPAKTPSEGAADLAKLKCRVEKDLYMDFEEYQHYTCAYCYNLQKKNPVAFKRELTQRAELGRNWLYDELTERALLPNETEFIRQTFKDESIYDKWRACCKHATECCVNNAKYLPKTYNKTSGKLVDEPNSAECPATWDGLTCWQQTKAGQIARRDCLRHVYVLGFEPPCTGFVSKECHPNASWFVRNNHEWSDYNGCQPSPIYQRRFLISICWHIISAIVILPAHLATYKMTRRDGNKRLVILQRLLFWLFANSCIQILIKTGIVTGHFERRPDSAPPPPPPPASSLSSQINRINQNGSISLDAAAAAANLSLAGSSSQVAPSLNSLSSLVDETIVVVGGLGGPSSRLARRHAPPARRTKWTSGAAAGRANYYKALALDKHIVKSKSDSNQVRSKNSAVWQTERPSSEGAETTTLRKQNSRQRVAPNDDGAEQDDEDGDDADEQHFDSDDKLAEILPNDSSEQPIERRDDSAAGAARCKRETGDNKQLAHYEDRRRQRSALTMFVCWFLQVASRAVRLMSYAWMFTGGVYCFLQLKFSPGNPPALFVRALMFLTIVFPIAIACAYVVARTLVEPSPLNVIFKVPYYKYVGDQANVDYLWATQMNCWLNPSRYDYIEEIADLPNLILVCLNVTIFIVTLAIICNIHQPGSTRPDMSPLHYFRAAGTLVILYGGHYALLAYRPTDVNCFVDVFMHYASLFVDGIQGIVVSYVFCFRASDGQEVFRKYWRNRRDRLPLKLCNWLCEPCCNSTRSRKKGAAEEGLLRMTNRCNNQTSNRSSRTSQLGSSRGGAAGGGGGGGATSSNGGGGGETVIESIKDNDADVANQF